MKLYTFETGCQLRLGAALDGKLIDLNAACAARLGHKNAALAPMMLELIRRGGAALKKARRALAFAAQNAKKARAWTFEFPDPQVANRRAQVRLLAPIPRPGKILCSGLNCRSHVEEEPGARFLDDPRFFVKASSAVVGPPVLARQCFGGALLRVWMAVSVSCALGASGLQASYGIYVGKNLTADGSVFLAGYGDEPSSHWLDIVPRREHPEGTMIVAGADRRAQYPGELIQIPQARVTFRYITMNYSSFAGFPKPLSNGGLNEHHVAGRDIWSPSREELRRMTPNPQRGLNYSDLSRIAMERARTAREAVRIIGDLMNQHGYATYGGNSHLFADADEGWIVINFAGGKGLWVAQRLGPDDIRVSRPGYIGEIPADFQNHPDFMGSTNLIQFAIDQGWYDSASGEPFNVNKIYGDGQMQSPVVARTGERLRPLQEDFFSSRKIAWMEERLRAKAGKITLQDVIAAVRDPKVTGDSAGYGQVAHLRKGVHPELGMLWVAAASSLTAPFIPYRMGVADVPPEFKWHRNLSEGEADRFMDPELQGLESTRYAFREFKRLFYLVKEHEEKFLPEVTEALEAFESRLIGQQSIVEQTALTLYKADQPELARQYLTYHSQTEAMNGLRLGQTLAESIEARTKVLYGIRQPAMQPQPKLVKP
ncbi:MAG: C69 family dipeptidase [Verrucomicrobiales bacterium]|nr:C69 family dipeptidase [Verrucomicrobiales bacterium]